MTLCTDSWLMSGTTLSHEYWLAHSELGFTREEIDRMIKDAEAHAEDDHKKRELVDARNMADSLIYSTEKSIKELGDKVDASTKGDVDRGIEKLKKAGRLTI